MAEIALPGPLRGRFSSSGDLLRRRIEQVRAVLAQAVRAQGAIGPQKHEQRRPAAAQRAQAGGHDSGFLGLRLWCLRR